MESDSGYKDNLVAAPPEDLSDEEIFDNSNKLVPYKKINENTSAGRLQMRVPDAPDNLIELIYRKKCVECTATLTTISSALMHYNSVKHQNKIALKFLPHGTYNLPLSKEEIREIETGVCKSGDQSAPGVTPPKISKVPFRELVKKFEINENVRKLDLEFCRLCEAPFSSKVAALQHYSGKKHKKKAENWSSYNPPKQIDTKDDLRCDVCNVISESISQMELHLSGKKHKIKMKAYVERVNAGAIAPPMSSRGFCDFNNVEREEANPIDPSRYLPTDILPKNLTGSFLDRCIPDTLSHLESFQENEFGPRRNSDNRFDTDFGANSNSRFESDFMEDFKPMPLNFTTNIQQDIKRGFDSNTEDDYLSSTWNNSLSRSQMNAPYAPNLSNRLGSKFPVQTFGPTKFRYSRNQQL